MENKFTLQDLIAMHELIITLRGTTVPVNEHASPDDIDSQWHQLDCLLLKMGNQFKEQLIDKESIEKLYGKKINSFKKQYDDKGMFTGVLIEPVSSVEFITCSFTVTPEGTKFLDDAKHSEQSRG
jgi:hypothetical protein